MKCKKRYIYMILFLIIMVAGFYTYNRYSECRTNLKNGISTTIDSYKGVDVYYNGLDYTKSYGKSYSKDGYYYGYKWQCVEYVKRFYYNAKNHKMPDGYGNAKDFFDKSVKQGELNKTRGLYQYENGGDVKPQPDDLLVFNDTNYGHVGIITEVGDNYIEIIQQNKGRKTREKYKMKMNSGKYIVGEKRKPAGWLRKKSI